MAPSESQDIESATTATAAPDAKTRRYDRQLRLWAATGQAALESCRILVIGGSATSTSILKNLVLPGIGHFTVLDHEKVTPEDAGNNFFLEGNESIGKSRAAEAVRLLCELNDSVDGKADERGIADVLESGKDGIDWILGFTIVVAHNLDKNILGKLSHLLWQTPNSPALVVVKTAGFLAEFSLQFHEHAIIESHSETAPSLRIDAAFPALKEHALSLDFENMDQTDHAHIPFVVILVRALEDWKKSHSGNIPKAYAEKKEFKANILSLKRKFDEENFEEAEAQAYRTWTPSTTPSEITALFQLPQVTFPSPPKESEPNAAFFLLLRALKKFVDAHENRLPLTGGLPDMKASTSSYIHLQKLYKAQAEQEKTELVSYLEGEVEKDLVDSFVKNAHGVTFLVGRKYGEYDEDKVAVGNALATMQTKEVITHLGLSALSHNLSAESGRPTLTKEVLEAYVKPLLPEGTDLDEIEEWEQAAGELIRTPTSDPPNTAAFMGGLVAQEVIKLITKQYVPIHPMPAIPAQKGQDEGRSSGVTVIDLIGSWTGTI